MHILFLTSKMVPAAHRVAVSVGDDVGDDDVGYAVGV